MYHIGSFLITGLWFKEVSSQKDSAVKKEGELSFFTVVDLTHFPVLSPRFEESEPRMIPCRMKWSSGQNTVFWFDLRIVQDKGLGFVQS